MLELVVDGWYLFSSIVIVAMVVELVLVAVVIVVELVLVAVVIVVVVYESIIQQWWFILAK